RLSSWTPSAKYAFALSSPRFSKGNTAIDFSGIAGACDTAVACRLTFQNTRQPTGERRAPRCQQQAAASALQSCQESRVFSSVLTEGGAAAQPQLPIAAVATDLLQGKPRPPFPKSVEWTPARY